MMTREQLVLEARSWLGVPFRHQGRSRTGVDCIGFAASLLHANGLLPDDLSGNPTYGKAPNTSEFIDTVERYCVWLDKVEDGCLITIAWPQAKYPSHTAIIDGKYMIHSYQNVGRVVRCGYGQPWLRMTRGRAHVAGIYRLPGITL